MYSPNSPDTLRLVNEARVLLKQNDAGSFTKPSNGQYPHQWNWDSAAIAIGLAASQPGPGAHRDYVAPPGAVGQWDGAPHRVS